MNTEPLLEAENLTVQYRTDRGMLTAVSNASFSIDDGEFFGLVGESGCGKSTIVKALIGGLDRNGRIESGEVRYQGEVIRRAGDDTEAAEGLDWTDIAWIPQASMNSLDPIERIDEQAVEIAQTHTDLSRSEIVEKLKEMFDIVGISPDRTDEYPHQFSGGMTQRALIAMALFLEPNLIIADEPTTALDVIMQDQVMKYLDRVREDLDTSMMLITHDISVVFESCHSMAIMHSGQIAETGSVVDLYDEPRHPYSILLQGAFPDHRKPNRTLEIIKGDPPQQFGDVTACTFADRCPWAVDECREAVPPLDPTKKQASDQEESHMASCFRKDEAYELYQNERQQEGDASGTHTGVDY